MNQACFRFHGELNELLPPKQRTAPLRLRFDAHQTVKHLFESLGVPHTEVGQVLVNGCAADFSSQPGDGVLVELHPHSPQQRCARFKNESSGFLLDVHLGKLARLLRLFGFDTLYFNQISDQELADLAESGARTLLSRDRRLLMRRQVAQGYCVRSLEPRVQAGEVLRRFGLGGSLQPFRRCARCNGLLQAVSKQAVLSQLQPLTRRYFDDFQRCVDCGQVYWSGSHINRLQLWMEQELLKETPPAEG